MYSFKTLFTTIQNILMKHDLFIDTASMNSMNTVL